MKFNFSEEVKALGVNGVYFVINGMKNKKNESKPRKGWAEAFSKIKKKEQMLVK